MLILVDVPARWKSFQSFVLAADETICVHRLFAGFLEIETVDMHVKGEGNDHFICGVRRRVK